MRISVCNSLTKGCLDFIQLIVRYYSKFHLKEWIYEKEEFITRFLEIELKGTLFCILNLSGNPVKERNSKSTCVDKRNNRENAGPIATFPGSDFHLKENTEGLAFKRRATAGHGTICFTRFRQAPLNILYIPFCRESMDNDRIAPCYFTFDLVQPRR